jgi:hypothetical protein
MGENERLFVACFLYDVLRSTSHLVTHCRCELFFFVAFIIKFLLMKKVFTFYQRMTVFFLFFSIEYDWLLSHLTQLFSIIWVNLNPYWQRQKPIEPELLRRKNTNFFVCFSWRIRKYKIFGKKNFWHNKNHQVSYRFSERIIKSKSVHWEFNWEHSTFFFNFLSWVKWQIKRIK